MIFLMSAYLSLFIDGKIYFATETKTRLSDSNASCLRPLFILKKFCFLNAPNSSHFLLIFNQMEKITRIKSKTNLSSIRRRELNSQPFDGEYPPLTTWPGLPQLFFKVKSSKNLIVAIDEDKKVAKIF